MRPGSFRYFQPESERRPSSSSATFTPAQAANNRHVYLTIVSVSERFLYSEDMIQILNPKSFVFVVFFHNQEIFTFDKLELLQ